MSDLSDLLELLAQMNRECDCDECLKARGLGDVKPTSAKPTQDKH